MKWIAFFLSVSIFFVFEVHSYSFPVQISNRIDQTTTSQSFKKKPPSKPVKSSKPSKKESLDKHKSEKSAGVKKQTASNMNQQVQKDKAPKSVDRVDSTNTETREKSHIHFKDGRVLNDDGTWRGSDGRPLTKKEKEWVEENGWTLPKE